MGKDKEKRDTFVMLVSDKEYIKELVRTMSHNEKNDIPQKEVLRRIIEFYRDNNKDEKDKGEH